MFLVMLVVIVILLLAVIPTWPHSQSFGYAPASFLGLLLIVVLALFLLGRF
jgi:uncharacterized protein DUF3309